MSEPDGAGVGPFISSVLSALTGCLPFFVCFIFSGASLCATWNPTAVGTAGFRLAFAFRGVRLGGVTPDFGPAEQLAVQTLDKSES